MTEANTSVNWNGVAYTAHASKGSKFGTGTGATAEEATAAAVKDLDKDPDKVAPTLPQSHTTGKPA